MIHSKIGELVRVAGFDTLRTTKGEIGSVLYGPYFTLAPGSYAVDFHVVPDHRGKIHCCTVDVLVGGKTIVARRRLNASVLVDANGAVSLPFKVDEKNVYEFRVFSTGRVGLDVRQERPLRLLSQLPPEAADLLPRATRPPELFKAHYAFFEGLSKQGFSFDIQKEAIVATYGGVSFTIENAEDFQLVGEIFLINEYNVITGREAVAIDIGMNAGLTSLYFAKMKHVQHVYSFEPFGTPFRRANVNFSFNPMLQSKITRNQIGLSDKNETLSVLATQTGTIGISVRGASFGESEDIVLRDASETLRPIIDEAVQSGRDLILKCDCEGSEFAVFHSLAESKLLDSVSAVVCEWHKWWSADKTQFDIIDPLIANGFTVIDRTNPTDPYAGLFYAVRTRQAHA